MTFELHENEYSSVNDDLNFDDFFTYKKIRTNKQITYYNDVIAFDIEASSFNDIEDTVKDTEVYDYLTGITIRITQKNYEDSDFSIYLDCDCRSDILLRHHRRRLGYR